MWRRELKVCLLLGPANLKKCVEDFLYKIGGFRRGFSWRMFLGTFSQKKEENKSGSNIRERIYRRHKK